MHHHNLLLEAMRFSEKAHAGQKRKYTGEPYADHPRHVMQLVAMHVPTATEDMLIAALLHDVVEDTEVDYPQISARFGDKVSDLVYWLTDQSQPGDGNREQRKALDRAHSARAPAEAQTIKVADMIDNASTIIVHDPGFAKVYMREKKLLLKELILANTALLGIAWSIVIKHRDMVEQEMRSKELLDEFQLMFNHR